MTTPRADPVGRRRRTHRPASVLIPVVAVLIPVAAVALTSAGTWQLYRFFRTPPSAPDATTAQLLWGLCPVMVAPAIAYRVGRWHIRRDLRRGLGAVPISGLALSGAGVCVGLLISAGTHADPRAATAAIVAGLAAALLQLDESRRTAALRRLHDLPSQDPGPEGDTGLAVLLSLRDTGGSMNDNPSVVLRARVTPDDGSPAFDAEFRDTVPRIAIPRPGGSFRVRYHPTDHSRTVRRGAFSDPAPLPGRSPDDL